MGRTLWSIITATTLLVASTGCSSGDDETGGATPSVGRSSASSSAPGSALKEGQVVHIGGSGDILIHTPVRDRAKANAGGSGYDFDPMFAAVKKPISDLDLAICHMETPLSVDNTNLSIPATMSFNVPHEVAGTLKRTGFDGCDRVGNHVVDRGLAGVASTKKVLDDAGLKNQGPSPENTDAQKPVTYDVKGLKVAHLAYSYTTGNEAASNTHVPADLPWWKYWQFPVVKAEGILADARKAKADGADVVVLSMHWGPEYSSDASPEQRELAKKLLESPEVDLILGTHVHVAQPCEKINGKYVVYGMGNFISNQSPSVNPSLKPATQDGMIVDVALSRGKDGKLAQKLTYSPTHVRIGDYEVQLATPTQNPEAYQRVTKTMSALGDKCDAKPAS